MMQEGPQVLDRDRHEVVNPPLFHYLKRELGPKARVFMYRHKFHKTWVLCEWLNNSSGRFVEVFNFDTDLGAVGHTDIQEAIRRFKHPATGAELLNILDGPYERQLREMSEHSMGEVERRMQFQTRKLTGLGTTNRNHGFSLEGGKVT